MTSPGKRGIDGHGESPPRGRRVVSADPVAATRAAMERLLALEHVEATGSWTELPHGRAFHLESGSGEPLLLLQGAGGGAGNWYRLIRPLARLRTVYVPELPGFGISDPIVPRPPLGLHAAAVMAQWLDANLGDRPVDLLGTSFGGLVALRLAQIAPARIRRIVLLNAAGLGRGIAMSLRIAGIPVARHLVSSPSRRGTALLFRGLLTSDRSQIPSLQQESLIDYMWISARGGAGTELSHALGLFAGIRGQAEVLGQRELNAIRPRVLIVWGGADRFLPPRHGPRAAAAMPDAVSLSLPGVGHSPNWEAPGAVIDAVQPFLDVP